MAKLLSILFKTGLGIFAAVIVVEAALHVIASGPAGKVFPVIEPQMGQPDTDIGFALTPNKQALWPRENRAFISTNSDGLRDREYSKNKNPETYRVALSGDSVTEALQVENRYVFDHLAESKFQYAGKDVEILNFAMSGNGPLRQLVRLEKFAPAYQPDMFVMLMSGADFQTKEMVDDSANPAYRINKDGSVSRSYDFRNRFSQRYADKPVGKAFMLLMHNSNLFRLLWQIKDKPFMNVLGLDSTAPKLVAAETDQCHSAEINALYDFWVGQNPQKNWLMTQHYFSEVADFAKGKPVIIGMYIPLIEIKSCTKELRKRQEVTNKIKQILSQHNVVFLDWDYETKELLSKGGSVDNLRGFGTGYGAGHLNYKGHEVFADVLYNIISRQSPLP